jgi:hypothetical protein
MIETTLWIDDEYIKRSYPLPFTFNNESLFPLIQSAQYIKAQDLIGTCLYEVMVDGVENETLDADQQELFKLLQYFVALHTIRSAANLLSTDIGMTPSGRNNLSNPEVVDSIKQELAESITSIEGRVLDLVLNTSSLLDTATGGDCADDNSQVNQRFKDKLNDTYSSPIYFRKRYDEDAC